ncbi:MAG TPA: Piwi domain-containing protein [Desulfobacteria bacterium]|nr:Piwi domain-containing protein [Desulfobacteria bacterium]
MKKKRCCKVRINSGDDMFLNSFDISGVEQEISCSLYSVDGLPQSNEIFWKLKYCARSFGNYLRSYATDYFYEGKPCVLLLGNYEDKAPFYVDNVYELKFLKEYTLDFSKKTDREAFRDLLYSGIRNKLETKHKFWGKYNTYYMRNPTVERGEFELYQGVVFRIDFYKGFMLTLDPTTKTLESQTLKQKMDEIGITKLTSELTGHKLVECFPDTKRGCRFHAVSSKKASEKSFLYKGRLTSVLEYHRDIRKRPDIAELINPNENVILIKYYDKQREPYREASSLLKSTVGTEDIPNSIQKDYIFLDPERRWELTKQLLNFFTPIKLGEYDINVDLDGKSEGKFQFDTLTLPTLEFGNKAFLEANDEDLRNWDFKKKNLLKDFGPYSIPRFLDTFVLFHSGIVSRADAIQFYGDIKHAFNKYLKYSLPERIQIMSYEDRGEIETWLSDYSQKLSGALALHRWEDGSYFYLKKVLKNIPLQCYRSSSLKTRGEVLRKYKNMIFVTAVGFAAKMGFKPWVLQTQLSADCYIGLDVGGDRSHVMGNCYIIDKSGTYMEIGKTIPQRGEAISEDTMVEIVSDAIFDSIRKYKDESARIKSIVIHRDGEIRKSEKNGISDAISRLKKEGLLPEVINCYGVELRKLNPFRIYEGDNETAQMCGIGSVTLLSNSDAILATTGAPSLTQGTANPLLTKVVSFEGTFDIKEVCRDVLYLSELNWGSPLRGMKMPVTIKIAEDVIPFAERGFSLDYIPW